MSADYFSVADEEFVFELVVDFLRSKKLSKAVELLQQEYSTKKAPAFGKQEQPTRLEVLVSEGLIAMSPIDATRAQKMDVWDSIPAQKRSHPHLPTEQPPSFAATLTAVPEEEELSAITPRSAQSEAGYLTHRATRTFSWSGPLIDVKKLTRKSGSTISPSSYGRSPRTSSLLEETRPPLQHSPRTAGQLTRHSSVRVTRSHTNPNSPKSPNSASMPKGAKAQNNFATTSMPSLPVVPLYPPSSQNSNSSPAMTAPPMLTPTSNGGATPVQFNAGQTPAPALPPPIITKTFSNPTSGPTTPNNIPPIPSFALPDKSLPIAALKNPSLAKVMQSGSAGSASDHPSSQSAVSSQLSVASPSLTSHPSTSSSDTVKPIKESSYTHSVDPRLIDSVRSDDDSDSEEEYTTSDDESSSDSDEYSDDDDQGYLRVPVKDNWDELQSTLSEVSDSDDEAEVSILSSQVLKQTKEDFDSDDSDDEVSLNNSKSSSSGKLKKSQTKKPHERNPSMGGGVFEMELSDAKKGIQYKLKSADEDSDFSAVNVVETTGGKHEFFNLKYIYVRGRTGFEESRDFPIRLHEVIAGRYEIIEYLGSAAFSRAVQCLDHTTGQMVCVKIIKNNKDFFDQSLDEIKLLKYIKANGDTEENHVIKMLDHFYYKEHLFIVCELLRENLYEFYKYNRESGEEIYFTLPRIQKVARQVLCALKYIHSLGLIHCDLKPENVLMRSYSRCEVKVIDFGSSCFLTDHLSTYVQSRSYRAPEVILGMPYDQRIDIWSLGCILAELYTGKVLFQNDSVQTLLARLVGIMGQLDRKYLKRGKYSAKYFTKNYTVLYDKRNGAVEYLYPKKSSLRRRLKTDDALFLDFMTRLLKVNARERPTAEEALEHPFLKFDFEKFPQGTKLTS